MLAASLRTYNSLQHGHAHFSNAPTQFTTHREEGRMPLVVCGSILARNEFKLFAGVSCIKGSFLSKTQALGLFLVLQFPNGEVEKRNYLITTIII